MESGMDKFSLQTFIKLCLMDTGGRISEIQKKLEATGGYDFYNSFQRATRIFCEDKKSEKPTKILAAPVKEAERKHNNDAFEAFKAKFGSSKSLEPIKKQRIYIPDGANFEISIDPLFSIEKSGVKYAYLPWTMQKPELSQKYAAVACFVMRQAYKSTNLSNWQFNIYDLTKGKAYTESQINEYTPKILNTDARTISTMLVEL
jgi:hypothetical protein